MVEARKEVSEGCTLEGERCTGRGNNDSCLCFFRRGSLNKFAADVLVFGVLAGDAGDRSPKNRLEFRDGIAFAEDGHSPLLLQNLPF